MSTSDVEFLDRTVRQSSADPAPGVEAVFVAATNLIVMACRIVLVTSAVVANRVVKWQADDGAGGVFAEGASSFAHPANTTIRYVGYPGATIQTVSGGVALMSFPGGRGLPLPKGYRLVTQTDGFDIGDNYGPWTLLVEALA